MAKAKRIEDMSDKELEVAVARVRDEAQALKAVQREYQHEMSRRDITRRMAELDPAGHVIKPSGIASAEKVVGIA